jgi:hypothetical protein
MQGFGSLLGCFIGSFLIIFFLIARFLFKVYRMVHKVKQSAQQFNDASPKQDDNQGTFYQHDYTDDTKETVVDKRDKNTANKKIFSDDEGEYVDFEEEK